MSKPHQITSDMTIDLNGHTLTSSQSSGYVLNANGAAVTLKNGTMSSNTRLGLAQNNGKIIIESGNYTSERDVAFEVRTGGEVILNGGRIVSQEGGIIAPKSNGKITVNGGEIETRDNFAIATNGNAGNKGNVITVNGGKLIGNITSSGYEAIGVYIANQDTFVMNDGEIIAHGGTGICLRAGDVTINGGKITATGTNQAGQPVADGKIGDDPTIISGVSAIVYHKSPSYQNEGMKLTVRGGVITGVDKSIDILSDEEQPNVTVTGGTLTPAYPAA